MRGNAHVRFGGRAQETDALESTHRASARPDHTCAALLIAQGAHPKAIQVHLGHSSLSVTMDRYGHLFPSDMEALAVALDGARSEALAVQMRTNRGPEVIGLTGK
jgi:hypothetical protein